MWIVVPGILATVVLALLYQESRITWALLIALVIAYANAVIGMALIFRGARASQSTFLKIVFGGMGARLLVLGAIIALIYTLTLLHFLTFLVALLAYYVGLMLVEILYVHRYLSDEMNQKNAEAKVEGNADAE